MMPLLPVLRCGRDGRLGGGEENATSLMPSANAPAVVTVLPPFYGGV
jgi:hypothetical protein